MTCFRCGGPYHESTGDYDKKWDVAFCGPCCKKFYGWLKGHTKRRWGGLNFYEHAARKPAADEPAKES